MAIVALEDQSKELMLPLEIQLNSLLEELVIGLLFDPIEKFFNGKTSIGDVASLAKRFHQALV